MPTSSDARAIAKYLHLGTEQGFGIISIFGMDTLRVRADAFTEPYAVRRELPWIQYWPSERARSNNIAFPFLRRTTPNDFANALLGARVASLPGMAFRNAPVAERIDADQGRQFAWRF